MKITSKRIAVIGITAAVYAVLTLFIPIPAYSSIQCRLSEVMNLLAFVNPIFAPGVTVGCLITAFFSPNGALMEIAFGVPATALSVFLISRSKNLFLASLFPVVINAIMIGLEIYVVSEGKDIRQLFIYMLEVGAGEFVAVSIVGYILFKFFLLKNKGVMNLLKNI